MRKPRPPSHAVAEARLEPRATWLHSPPCHPLVEALTSGNTGFRDRKANSMGQEGEARQRARAFPEKNIMDPDTQKDLFRRVREVNSSSLQNLRKALGFEW